MIIDTITKPLEIVIGFLVTILVSGNLLSHVLFPRRPDDNIAQRLGLSGGIGLVLAIFIGQVWVLLSQPLNSPLFPFIPFLLALFVYGCNKLISRKSFRSSFNPGLFLTYGVKLAIGIAIVGAGIGLGGYLNKHTPRDSEYFTEFWVLGPGSGFSDQIVATQSSPQSIQIGIISHEAQAVEYTIHVRTETKLLDQLGPIVVEENGVWEGEYILDITRAADEAPYRVVFELYKNSEPYRLVYLAVKEGDLGQNR
jgi:uncharacterized membrane protein